jgi:hypothetical protein
VEGGAFRHAAPEESAILLDGRSGREFDLWIRFEATSDAILGAFLPTTTSYSAGSDYIAFVGGYGNSVTRFRLFGRETGESTAMLTPGEHRMQLSRRANGMWTLLDGLPILWAPDPRPDAPVGALAVLGGYGGAQRIYEIRYRVLAAAQ